MTSIIQTNTIICNGKEKDFQSMVFKYSSWDDYRRDMLDENYVGLLIEGTMVGNIKPRFCKVVDVIINDDYHFEVVIDNGYTKINIKSYKVDEHKVNFIKQNRRI